MKKKELTSVSIINSAELNDYLNNLGVHIKHGKKDYLKINDIFVYPDIKDINDNSVIKKTSTTVENILKKYDFIYFLGTEEIGKTTLLKKIAKDFVDKGTDIIILNGADIKTDNIERLLVKFYENFSVNPVDDLSQTVLLIDDFAKQNIKDSIIEDLLNKFTSTFMKVIIFIDKNKFIQNSGKYLSADFNEVEILPFGHLKRHEFIRKWLTIGDDNSVTVISNEVYDRIDEVVNHFDSIMKKNIMDSRPIYLISILQTLENLTLTNGNYSLTSYGQCYHILITSMLNKANISLTQELDGILNFLSYLAFYFYDHNIEEITEDDFDKLYNDYKATYVPINGVKNILIDSGILATPDNYVFKFSQKYLYYFCCARYISDNSESMKEEITLLCKNVHNEQKANILIFLVHHLRGTGLLDEILTHTVCLLDGVEVFDMTAESNRKFKQILGQELQKIVFEQKNTEHEREKMLRKKDEFEEEINALELAMDDHDLSKEDLEPTVEFDFLQEATSAIRSLEVLGQIAKNRHSSLKIDELNSILSTTYDTGLKVLNFYLSFFKDSEDDLKNLFKSFLLNKNNINSDEEAIRAAEKLINNLCFSICFYMIQLISKSTAHNRLVDISSSLSEKINSPAYKLINLYSQLIICHKLPKKIIKDIAKDNKNNPLVYSLLKNMVANHLYLYNLEYKDMQWIQSQFNIAVDEQIRASNVRSLKLLN